MKKLLVLSLALAMVVAFTLPASALENVFGGYWRTRAYTNQQFSGQNDSADDESLVDTRTRLYYTAILNDNLKFVNKFEMDAKWGQANQKSTKNDPEVSERDNDQDAMINGRVNRDNYGDLGADGVSIEVKNTYADFNVGPTRWEVGVHGRVLGRGFIMDDDFSGLTVSFKMGENLIPFTWGKINEGYTDNNSQDADFLALWPVFKLGENFTLNPYIVYAYSDNTGRSDPSQASGDDEGTFYSRNPVKGIPADADDGVKIYWLGANIDGSVGAVNFWGTAIYQGGNADSRTVDNYDIKAYVLAAGGSVPLGPTSLHGQVFYASGDDDADDNDLETFFGVSASYYWSEIMGFGIFDDQVSAGSPGDQIGNIWAANIGATIKPIEKLSLTGDIWYASLVEDNPNNDKKLGIEVDAVATYQLVEGLNLDLVGAYLFADNATTSTDESNDENPWEVGTRLSLSF